MSRYLARVGLVLVGLALCAWAFIPRVLSAEEVRAEGRTVLFDMRPVDPRALLLGDYMQIGYVRSALPPAEETDDRIAVLKEVDGLAVFQRTASEGEGLGPEEFILRFKREPGPYPRYTYGGQRYYFQSGTAERYRDAEYSVWKIMPDGRGLLSGLADENKQIIAVAGETPK